MAAPYEPMSGYNPDAMDKGDVIDEIGGQSDCPGIQRSRCDVNRGGFYLQNIAYFCKNMPKYLQMSFFFRKFARFLIFLSKQIKNNGYETILFEHIAVHGGECVNARVHGGD